MKSLEKISCKLTTALTPYKPLIGPLASCFTVGQFLAESLICLDIIARRSTRGVPSWPFVGGFVIGTLMLKYSLMIEDFSMFVVNFTGVLLNLFHILIYNKFCRRRRRELHEPLRKGLIFVAFTFLYSFWEKEEFLGYRYGMIVTILMLVLNGSPLLELSDIIECEDASKIQLPLTAMTCMSCLLWFLYGFIIRSDFIVIQNFFGFLSSFIQSALYLNYYEGFSGKTS
ncbi:sugar transporter SWEET1-like [Agrilus planipennis]|uniref:Sugar transporter SWEET n=1 Tax=Agrilus planipennis TaxID=224129 RepID=A0A1W4XSQ0_AGRPL|nr:sugar transporter SWEET1-like [Agrilus planipennis]